MYKNVIKPTQLYIPTYLEICFINCKHSLFVPHHYLGKTKHQNTTFPQICEDLDAILLFVDQLPDYRETLATRLCAINFHTVISKQFSATELYYYLGKTGKLTGLQTVLAARTNRFQHKKIFQTSQGEFRRRLST